MRADTSAPEGAVATRSAQDAGSVDGAVNAPDSATVEYRTSISSLFSVQPDGPSALPVRTGSAYIGTPPLAKAIDLLRSMMIAFRQSQPATEAAPPARAAAPPPGGGMAAPPSNVAQA